MYPPRTKHVSEFGSFSTVGIHLVGAVREPPKSGRFSKRPYESDPRLEGLEAPSLLPFFRLRAFSYPDRRESN
jgi:hypothetical protein